MAKRRFRQKMYRDIQFEKIAKQTELSYTYNDEFGLINLLKDFKLFDRLAKHSISNILGEKTPLYEMDFRVFDYEYQIWTGETEEISKQTVFFVQSKNLGLPQFYMEPERFFTKAGKYLGIEDIDFEAFPQFSDQYWLKGESESEIRNAMSDKVLHYFTVEKDWSLEGINYFLIFYKKDKIIPTTDLLEFYKKGKAIVDLFSQPTG